MEQFVDAWAAAWAEYGTDEAGRPTYAQLIDEVRSDGLSLGSKERTLSNNWPLNAMFESLIFQMALAPPPQASGVRGTVTSSLSGVSRVARG
jgi:hypothetical protein